MMSVNKKIAALLLVACAAAFVGVALAGEYEPYYPYYPPYYPYYPAAGGFSAGTAVATSLASNFIDPFASTGTSTSTAGAILSAADSLAIATDDSLYTYVDTYVTPSDFGVSIDRTVGVDTAVGGAQFSISFESGVNLSDRAKDLLDWD
mmetsp:Transcript_2328/g.5454  ORF Transcript_2328/g.5454 Transcript_2328/m.5454 type:complete len:149 (+) Transcript_2328:145-591(+)